ncbi:hypothetical protein AGRA3207_007882 (plasmid) [Actinomadura graeca]|uniref:Uncharacterized protein n=1 Tax=Actinomadura graeca TaxID=2750812 RepID=A0ABX8R9W3_9ACTN|nr:hypothetical protein [Actinomadura graeca]QXJ27084.1 hypothetical protein AGRA3207_007882 [Actinomadura graeca]
MSVRERAAAGSRRECPNRLRRRTASYGDDEALPTLAPDLWIRVVELLFARGELDGYARRMARHVTFHASARGRLADVEDGLIPGYKVRHGIGRRSAYTDIGRLAGAGLLRQVHAACPGRGVVYQMCVPPEVLVDLPSSLRARLRRLWARPTREARAAARAEDRRAPVSARVSGTAAIRVWLPVAERHRVLAGCAVVRVGSAAAEPTETQLSCGRLHTSPFLKRDHPQPLFVRSRQGYRPPPPDLQMATFDHEGIRDEVITRCMALWSAQRPPDGLPDDAAMARLRPLLWAALCTHTSSDVIEALTTRVRSARDLGAVAATRLRRMVMSARRAARLAVDDTGARAAALADERDQLRDHAMTASATARAAARQALADIRDHHRDQRHDRHGRYERYERHHHHQRQRHRPPPGGHARADEATAEDVLDPGDLAMLRQAMANAATGTRPTTLRGTVPRP